MTKREIDILSPVEVRQVLDLIRRGSPTGARQRALIAVLYGSGLRISEALALRPKDLDLENHSVRVHRGKGDKARTAALLPAASEYVATWLTRRAQLGLNGRAPVFCTITSGMVGRFHVSPGGPLSSAYVRNWFLGLAKKARAAGLDKRLHAHGFRHSHADQLRRRGWDMVQIQKQLGHGSLAVTTIYLNHIGAPELAARMAGEDWGL